MKKFWKCARGGISVMLAILLSGVLSLALLLVEGGRLQIARQELDDALGTSGLSVLGGYNTDLEKRFGLYAVNDPNNKTAETFNNCFLINTSNAAPEDVELKEISKLFNVKESGVTYMYDLANYQVLKRQLLEYSKYRAPIDVAEDFLDIDKMLDKLVKKIEQLTPTFTYMLQIVDSIADIWTALKAIYQLEKTIQALQLSIGVDGSSSFSDQLNDLFGQGWKGISEFFSGDEWPTCDPTYLNAYSALSPAISNKTQYMRTHPEPPRPVEPTSNLNEVTDRFNSIDRKYKQLNVLCMIMEQAKNLGYSDARGIVDGSSNITELYNNVKNDAYFREYSFGLTSDTTRSSLYQTINNKLSELIGASSTKSNYSLSELSASIEQVRSGINEMYASWEEVSSEYSTVKAEWEKYNKDKEAFDAYQKAIAEYVKTINEKKSSLKTTISGLKTQLGTYRSQISSIKSKLQKAVDACKNITENVKQLKRMERVKEENEGKDDSDILAKTMSPEEYEEYLKMHESATAVGEAFEFLLNMIIAEELEKPEQGIIELDRQLTYLNDLDAEEDVTASYVFNMGKGGIDVDGKYFMTKSDSLLFIKTITGMEVIKKFTYVSKMIDNLIKIIKAFKPFNETYDYQSNVVLNASTSSILPSKLNGGNGSSGGANDADAAKLATMLEEARNLVNSSYGTNINSVDPQIRQEEADLHNDVMAAIDRLEENIGEVFSEVNKDSWASMIMPGVGLILAIANIIGMIDTIRQIIEDLKFVFNNIKVAISVVLSNLGENLLLNYYSTYLFPNRINNTVSGMTAQPRTFTPDNSKPYQTFCSAQVEYIIYGDDSEKVNQRKAYWTIMALRLVNNAIAVLFDDTAMELISACNVFAPIVWIAWFVYESIIDMNLLLDVKQELPLIKTQIILSPNTLMSGVDNLIRDFEVYGDSIKTGDVSSGGEGFSQAEEHLKALIDPNGLFKMDYKGYLTLCLFFVPNKTKTLRIADLIQMEMRYKQFINGKTVNFLMEEADTYVRVYSYATFNPILPIMSLTGDGDGLTGWKIQGVKYVGY